MGKTIKDLQQLINDLENYIKEGGELDSEYKKAKLGAPGKNISSTFFGGLYATSMEGLPETKNEPNLFVDHPIAYDLVKFICAYSVIEDDILQEIQTSTPRDQEISGINPSVSSIIWGQSTQKVNSASQNLQTDFNSLKEEVDKLIKEATHKVLETYDDVTQTIIDDEVSKSRIKQQTDKTLKH